MVQGVFEGGCSDLVDPLGGFWSLRWWRSVFSFCLFLFYRRYGTYGIVAVVHIVVVVVNIVVDVVVDVIVVVVVDVVVVVVVPFVVPFVVVVCVGDGEPN